MRTIRLSPSFIALILVSAMFIAVSASASATVYVNAAATGTNNGTSWANAYTNLSTALAATQTGEIWVASGTYRPAGPNGNRELSFNLKSGVALYGGFVGNETALAQRNPASNPTILSGDLNGNDAAMLQTEQYLSSWLLNYSGYIADDNFYFENSRHVVRANNVNASSVLDGFRIVGGRTIGYTPAPPGAGYGAGLYLINSSPRIANCVILNNLALNGGGVYSSGGSPVFQSNEFRSNFAYRGMGGGLYATSVNGNTIAISDSTFVYNSAKQGQFTTGHGGAIFNDGASTLSVTRSTFNGNVGWHNGSFGYRVTGGAISNLGPAINVTYSKFVDNAANLGGAIYTLTGGAVTNSLFTGNQAWAVSVCGSIDCPNNVIADPFSGYGGAIYASANTITVTNNTLSNNHAARRGGGIAVGTATLNVRNSILWGNTIPPVCCGENPIEPIKAQVFSFSLSGPVSYRYSDVQSLGSFILKNPNNYPGSIDQNPLFVNGVGIYNVPADLHVGTGSPTIDAGENASVLSSMLTDLDGQPRFADAPATPNTGLGVVPVDMGVYEVAGTAAPLTVQSPGNRSGVVGAAVTLALSVYNPNGATLSFTATGLPPGLTIGAATGVISGTFATGSAGTYPVAVTVFGGTATSSASFTWTVTTSASPPPPPPVPGGLIDLKGTIESVDVDAIVVAGTLVLITPDTAITFEDSSGGVFTVGHIVKLQGTDNGDGSLTAVMMTAQ